MLSRVRPKSRRREPTREDDALAQEPLADAIMLDRSAHRSDAELFRAESPDGMVATAHYRATRIGAEVLGAGGNAIDAAIAAGLALSVCEPAGSGLGGMAMMLVHRADTRRTFTIEGPCRAPRSATPEAVAASNRYRGARAAAVPTQVSVFAHAHERFGSLPIAELIEPSARLADDGLPVTPLFASLVAEYASVLAQESGGAVYLDANGAAPAPGSVFRNPALASTLRRLADAGFDDFYRGDIAREIATHMQSCDGFIAAEDLAELEPPLEGEPLRGSYRGRTLDTLGPPGGGVTVLHILNLLEASGRSDLDVDDPDDAVHLAEVIRRARLERKNFYLGIGKHPDASVERLLEPERIATTAATIRAREAEAAGSDPNGSGETTHVVTADRAGNVVSMTQSIERSFGSSVVTPALGFLYNGYLRAFKVQSKMHPHYIRPGAPARSSAAPTIISRDGVPESAIGSSGSERMASSIVTTLLRLWRHGDAFRAVLGPRLHATPDDRVLLERERWSDACIAALEARGFKLEMLDAYAFKTGGLQLLTRDNDSFIGVGEPRRDGAASGPVARAT